MRIRARWSMVGHALLLAASLCLMVTQARAQAAPTPIKPPTTQDFSQLPMVMDLSLSPDGQHVAGLLNIGDNTVLFTRGVNADKLVHVSGTDNKTFRIAWLQWASNDRLVFGLRFAASRDFVGTVETRLLSVKRDGTGLINLVRSSPFSSDRNQGQFQDRVVDWLPEDGHHILMELNEGYSYSPAVFKVNLDTGLRQMVHTPRRNIRNWVTDNTHRVRLGVVHDEAKREVQVCDPDGGNWRTLWRYEVFGKDAVYPLGFGLNPNELYISANHEGRLAVFKVNLASPDLKREPVLSHPNLDVSGQLIRSQATGQIIGIHSGVQEEQRPDFWDPSLRLLARAIDKALPERFNSLIELSRDEQHYLIYSVGNGKPGEYYLGNRKTGDLTLVAETHPELQPASLVGKRPVQIKARDGLVLAAYLTQPANVSGPQPLVLLPHGGPHSRDNNRFDVWTEFLASRGYAVLQVNFRGSAGFGHDMMVAGLQRWGLEMQDDLTDAVQWAIAQGVADPKRVGIVGFSYGGYAALMGSVKTPELFRCAVSVAGVTDLIDLWYHQNQYIGGAAIADKQFGNAWSDRKRLTETSPALQAERINVPVLLIHGTDDRTVPFEQAEAMDKALRRAKVPHRFVELEGGDHQLSRNSHRLTVFKELEDFLAQNMGAPKVLAQQQQP